MKVLLIDTVPNYEKVCVVCEDHGKDSKDGHEFTFVKAMIVPLAASKIIKVGDEVLPLYDNWKRLVSFQVVK